MKIIILAAGKGSRLGKINKNKPKCLIKINGKSLIERNMELFKRQNLNPVLVTGYKKEKLNFLNVPTIFNSEFETTNMLWSLYKAKEHMSEDFLVCYSDILVNSKQVILLKNFVNGIGLIIDKQWLSYWKLRFENPLDDAESLKISSNGYITDIGRKEDNLKNIQGQYIGFFKVSGEKRLKFVNKLINFCQNRNTEMIAKKAYLTDFFQILIKDLINIKAIPTFGGWIEIDNPNDINVAQNSGRLKMIEEHL